MMAQTYFEAPHNIRHDKFCDRLAAIGEEAGWLCTREADRLVWCGVGAEVGEKVRQTAAAIMRRVEEQESLDALRFQVCVEIDM